MPAKRRSRIRRFRWLLIPGAVAFWFLAVDWSWFVEDCPDCFYQRHLCVYRVCGIPLHTQIIEYHTPFEFFSRDLGYPCPHPRYWRFHKYRLWGLCVCKWPCHHGTFGVEGGPQSKWYPPSRQAEIKGIAATRPSLGEEFRERVVYHHDMDYWLEFCRPLEPLRPETMTQPE